MISAFSFKTPLAFALLHSVLQGQICLLLQIFLNLLSKFLIQVSVDGWGCVPSLQFGLRLKDSRGNGNVPEKDLCQHSTAPRTVVFSALTPWQAAGDSWTLTGKSGSVPCGITAPFSWVLVHSEFCLCPPRVYVPSPVQVL